MPQRQQRVVQAPAPQGGTLVALLANIAHPLRPACPTNGVPINRRIFGFGDCDVDESVLLGLGRVLCVVGREQMTESDARINCVSVLRSHRVFLKMRRNFIETGIKQFLCHGNGK